MAKINLSGLAIYPLKSAKAINLSQAHVSEIGLEHDRRFVISDMQGQFITGRTQPKIATIKIEVVAQGIMLSAPQMPPIAFTFKELQQDYTDVVVWGTPIQGQRCSDDINRWLTKFLAVDCQLLYFGEHSSRQVDNFDKQLGFADGFPLLLISQASLDELNRSTQRPIEMSQFRTNLVVTGCEPFAEDSWKRIKIGDAEFELVKACERCIFTTLSPGKTSFAEDREPLKTLSLFRKDNDGRIDFGQNLISHNDAEIKLGDSIEVLEYHQPKVYADNRPKQKSVMSAPRAAVIPSTEQQTKTLWGKSETRQLSCVAVIDETPDTKTFRFRVEPAALLNYKPGQFITLNLKIGQDLVMRNYTLSSSPSRPDLLAITVKRVPEGKASNWLNDNLTVGGRLGASSPRGPFHAFTATTQKLLLLSAGSGITPMLSMARYYADTECDKDIVFFYSAKTAADLIALDELQLLTRQHTNMRLVFTLTAETTQSDWTGLRGRIDQQMLADVVRDISERSAYVCGPEAFMTIMSSALTALNVPAEQQFTESFGDHKHSETPGKPVNILLDSWDTSFVGDNKTTLLEQAEKNGVNIPYNCRAGYCGVCRVTLESGEVRVLADHALTDDGKKAKKILACSCIPQTDIVIS
ncbi:MAG: hybrid-cluster NAD(P)-dependent oxidoreductase [Moritella sp.]|uniref:hybrid-cluster NAD(P)-dependent oxidoreductase n=1 Tax=Moritella sp. TaxID=78556 RepID=UPI0029A32068|nr:hybrid-cluster NAD(P)-dependent oxidoreductase [Moritella sp.]MDX2320556.1 hybrid-cluster NAD(P)-dependent oxidoreductase [Moritella sp.]